MTKPHSDDSNLPVAQTELATQDMDLLSELSRQVYVEHTARFRCADPHLVDGRINWAVTESVAAGMVRYAGFVCQAEMEPADMPNAAVLKQGVGEISNADEELRYGPGCAFLLPG